MASRAGRIKKNSTASPRHSRRASSEDDHIVNDVLMKERIRTLEAEVCTLKTRLDALRRAKNTTIIKGGAGKSGRSQASISDRSHGDCNHGDINEKCSCDATILELKRSHDQELRSHELEMDKLKGQLKALDHQHQDDRLHEKIRQLQEDNEGLQRDNEQLHKDKDDLQSQLDGVMVANSQLASCNSILRSKCDQMLEQLSVKEANWSHHEEELQLQLRQQWGERYQEWITKAENKMKELQSINQMLQAMLKTKQEHVELQ